MPPIKLFLSVLIMSAVTFLTRAMPFIIFDKKDRPVPGVVLFLGKYLPPALICIIIVYCFRGLNILNNPHFPDILYDLKEIIAASAVIVLHLWKRNTMISVFAGTAIYMFLVQQVF